MKHRNVAQATVLFIHSHPATPTSHCWLAQAPKSNSPWPCFRWQIQPSSSLLPGQSSTDETTKVCSGNDPLHSWSPKTVAFAAGVLSLYEQLTFCLYFDGEYSHIYLLLTDNSLPLPLPLPLHHCLIQPSLLLAIGLQ